MFNILLSIKAGVVGSIVPTQYIVCMSLWVSVYVLQVHIITQGTYQSKQLRHDQIFNIYLVISSLVVRALVKMLES